MYHVKRVPQERIRPRGTIDESIARGYEEAGQRLRAWLRATKPRILDGLVEVKMRPELARPQSVMELRSKLWHAELLTLAVIQALLALSSETRSLRYDGQ